ncbi:prolyl aminopeptidase [Formosa sp. PL04]|uniref:prolyl aminopeptidase n=1 Tax=Formosa sp. PL04 TaxID=3081755 RepID=UPI0029828BF4|nr:prolyl aminopeptidase [Formosa sp. PL04]MDW5290792.1 prolyl aminopeptidase [Formosa sp. PL04]
MKRFESNYLRVSKTHNIYFEVFGITETEPILFVHGGPGAGFSENDKRFFDFKKQKVIFFDQRGSSKSLPFGSIIENTTQDLVQDINTLLDYLEIDKIILFGGSWGTTLGLVYAIQNPNRIKGLVLRGIFLGNQASIDHYLNGGVKKEFPEVWERFSKKVPKDRKLSIPEFYLDKMIYGSKEEQKHFAYEWAFYEISIYKKNITKKAVEDILDHIPYESLSIMEAHYLGNNCFITENYILEHVNLLDNIPIKIVHGKDDAICPLKFAIELNDKLTHSDLYITEGGHSDSEPEIEHTLIDIIHKTVW